MEKYPSFDKIRKMVHNKIDNTSCLFEKIKTDYQHKKKDKSYIQSTLFSEGIQQLLLSIISDNKEREDDEESSGDNCVFCSYDHFKKQFRGEKGKDGDFFDSLSFEKSVVLESADELIEETAGFEKSVVVHSGIGADDHADDCSADLAHRDKAEPCREEDMKRNSDWNEFMGGKMGCEHSHRDVRDIRKLKFTRGSDFGQIGVNCGGSFESEEKHCIAMNEGAKCSTSTDVEGRHCISMNEGDGTPVHVNKNVTKHRTSSYARCITNQNCNTSFFKSGQCSAERSIKQTKYVHETVKSTMHGTNIYANKVINIRLKRGARSDDSSVKVHKNKKMRLSAVRKLDNATVGEKVSGGDVVASTVRECVNGDKECVGRSVLRIENTRNLKRKLRISEGAKMLLSEADRSLLLGGDSHGVCAVANERDMRNEGKSHGMCAVVNEYDEHNTLKSKLLDLKREELFLNRKLTLNRVTDVNAAQNSAVSCDLFGTRSRIFKKQGIFLKENKPMRRKSLKINIKKNRKKYKIEFKDDSSVLSSNDKCPPDENISCNREVAEQMLSEAELVSILKPKTRYFSTMNLKGVKKVAEASFSDVYKFKDKIYKIIPFTEYYTKEEFLREVYVLKTLQNEKYVIKMRNFFLCKGAYNQHLYTAWDAYAKKHKSENKRPSGCGKGEDYGCLVMEDAGTDLENYQFKKISDILFFLKIIIECLSVLEFKYQFEHRDLHWGNILIQDNSMRNDSLCTFSENLRNFNLSSRFVTEDSAPFKVSIIDFGLSRLSTDHGLVYKDLSPEKELFEGTGDEQYDVYRLMKKICCNEWSKFNPFTNVLWIKYLVNKLKDKGLGEELCDRIMRMVVASGSATELEQHMQSI